ncbi:asparagine synthase (glutamine-hydrolyzing) [Candidatus Pelagibacter sp.]|nr:asparagine synthase (glutamine-hydrolyzing) [Candidatus Pelagibacter sp.]
MCGISGIYNFANKDIKSKEIIRKIINLQNVRGPDNNNIWSSNCNKVHLGHNRLSIIDLSSNANQPFISNDRNYIITFNGEIYNYKLIRKELEQKKIIFKSNSDTEVILESYKLWGLEFLNKLRGMFSFVIWDDLKKKMILVRDPFGIKPLYYTKKNDIFYFASEINSILSIKNLQFNRSEKSLVSYLLWGNIQEPLTLYKDINSIRKGSVKILNENGSEQDYVYANIKDEILNAGNDYFKSEDELNEKLEFLINETVKLHYVSDVPVTLLLSAGIDSSAILGSLSDTDKKKCSALTLDFKFNNFQCESHIARKSAKMNNIEHVTKEIDEHELQKLINDFYLRMDSPTNDGLNNFLVSHIAKKNGSKVIISGIGGDEFFFGYPSYKRIPKINSWLKILPKNKIIGNLVFNLLSPILKMFNLNPKYAGIIKYGSNIDSSYFLQRSLMFPEEIKEMLAPDVFKEGFDELDIFNKLENDIKNFNNINLAIMYLEIKYYLSSKLLRDADWTSMSHSIELRTPFVDWSFFRKLLPILKSNKDVSKINLLNCFKKKLPEELYNRKKTGFDIPHKYFYESYTQKKISYHNPLKDWSLLSIKDYL